MIKDLRVLEVLVLGTFKVLQKCLNFSLLKSCLNSALGDCDGIFD